jgi:hypothetical protein
VELVHSYNGRKSHSITEDNKMLKMLQNMLGFKNSDKSTIGFLEAVKSGKRIKHTSWKDFLTLDLVMGILDGKREDRLRNYYFTNSWEVEQ